MACALLESSTFCGGLKVAEGDRGVREAGLREPADPLRIARPFRVDGLNEYAETDEDRKVRDAVARVLAAHRQQRPHNIGKGKPDMLARLRDCFDYGTGLCDPANASLAPLALPTPCPAVQWFSPFEPVCVPRVSSCPTLVPWWHR